MMQAAAPQAAQDRPNQVSILLRRARAVAVPPVPVVPPRAPDRVIAAAIGRAADRTHGLSLFFDRVAIADTTLAEVAELLPERPLLSVVEGADDGLGLVAICPGLLASVIEMQAIGRVSSRPAGDRRPTRTDGAVCADFVNACLAELGADLSTFPGFSGVAGFRYASYLDDPRPLDMLLDDLLYRRIDIALRAGSAGQRDGRLIVILPRRPDRAALPPAGAPSASLAPTAPGLAADAPAGVSAAMSVGAMVRAAPLTLHGVLCRRRIGLGELRALVPGQTIALPPGVLDMAVLETATGQAVARGRLGELGGRHALRLLGTRAGAGLSHAGGATDDVLRGPGPGFGDMGAGALPDRPVWEPAPPTAMPLAAPAFIEPPIGDLIGSDPFRIGLDSAEAGVPSALRIGGGDGPEAAEVLQIG